MVPSGSLARIKHTVLEKIWGDIAGDNAGEKRKDVCGLAHSKPSNIGDRSRTQQKISSAREPESLNLKRVRQDNATKRMMSGFEMPKWQKLRSNCEQQIKKDIDFTSKSLF
jgi:hypothetical protein